MGRLIQETVRVEKIAIFYSDWPSVLKLRIYQKPVLLDLCFFFLIFDIFSAWKREEKKIKERKKKAVFTIAI